MTPPEIRKAKNEIKENNPNIADNGHFLILDAPIPSAPTMIVLKVRPRIP
jgi:hypothetical protein